MISLGGKTDNLSFSDKEAIDLLWDGAWNNIGDNKMVATWVPFVGEPYDISITQQDVKNFRDNYFGLSCQEVALLYNNLFSDNNSKCLFTCLKKQDTRDRKELRELDIFTSSVNLTWWE